MVFSAETAVLLDLRVRSRYASAGSRTPLSIGL